MEKLREVDTIVVDKTGTLTVGRPSVSEIVAREGWSGDDVLAAAASVNQSSEHPLARAITDAALTAGITFDRTGGVRGAAGFRSCGHGPGSGGPGGQRRVDAYP